MGYDLPVRLIYALHGFLGQGSDWDRVKSGADEWITPSYFAKGEDYIESSLAELKRQPQYKKIFVGYSLGGRIGLSILKNNPGLFDHFIFISVNPGLPDSDTEARTVRWQQDQLWAEKISEPNWQNFLTEWNSQPVLAGAALEPSRKVENFDIAKLKAALTERSLAKQPDYSALIEQNKDRITWIVGAHDKKFFQIAENLKTRSVINDFAKIESGHRIPFDSPKKLSEIISAVKV
jgi:2-succinyl-6-hydroxy-2,4-cyclohexadiene-1-carboxylate synthase